MLTNPKYIVNIVGNKILLLIYPNAPVILPTKKAGYIARMSGASAVNANIKLALTVDTNATNSR
jgi:hypothetical protein